MIILNPNKYIRQAYIDALSLATGLDVWEDRVPKTINPVPKQYILLLNQTKNETANAKNESEYYQLTYFEWLCTVDVQIFNINQKGYSRTEIVDDIEEKVMSIIRNGITIPNFSNKNTSILDSLDLPLETVTQSVDRRVIKFEQWLSRTIIYDEGVGFDYAFDFALP